MNPHFIIDKVFSMNDEYISLSLKGLPPECLVTIKAESSNYYGINALPNVGAGSVWSASCTFLSSLDGEIKLTTDAPLSGSYEGVSGMGLFYSMKPIKIVNEKKPMNLQDVPVLKSYDIHISAYEDTKKLCVIPIKRAYQKDDVIHQDVFGKYFVARLFRKENKKNQSAIIVLSGSDGRIEKAQSIAQQFASRGFAALAVCYFGLDKTSKSLSEIPLEIIEESIDFLKSQNSVDSKKIAVYGRSKGGELALLAGSKFSEISCVVANTPSGFVFEGLNEKNRNSKTSTWTYQKEIIPYIPFKIMPFVPYMFKKILFKKNDLTSAYLKLLDKKVRASSRIPVENINGPILLISAKNDEIWPSTLFCHIMMKQLKNRDFSYPFEHIAYENSGHHLTIAYQPNPRYKERNCLNRMLEEVDEWEKTLSFLNNWSQT